MLFLIKVSIIIHLGKNPKNGGNPPNEIIKIDNEILKKLLFWNILNIWLIWNILKLLNKFTTLKFKKV